MPAMCAIYIKYWFYVLKLARIWAGITVKRDRNGDTRGAWRRMAERERERDKDIKVEMQEWKVEEGIGIAIGFNLITVLFQGPRYQHPAGPGGDVSVHPFGRPHRRPCGRGARDRGPAAQRDHPHHGGLINRDQVHRKRQAAA